MKKVRFYIKDVLEILCNRLTEASIGDKVYAEHRPNGIGEQLQSLSVVSLPSEIVNNGAYQSTQVYFHLISRNREGGISTTDLLQLMLDKLINLFPIKEDRFTLTSPRVVLNGDDGNGFTIWIVQASLVINTTDRY